MDEIDLMAEALTGAAPNTGLAAAEGAKADTYDVGWERRKAERESE